MLIDKYGVVLRRMQSTDQETVRNWRNAEHVRPYMSFREYITSDQQASWFKQLDLSKNFYFIIEQQNKSIGVVNLKDLDSDQQIAEAGIFIGNEAYLNSMVPVLATISLMEFAFETLKLKSLKAKINCTNLKTIRFNEGIGYVKSIKESGENEFDYYTVSYENFLRSTEKLRNTLNKLK